MSSCVICVVIAREIFLLKSDCPEITKVHNKFKNNDKNGNLTFKYVVDDQLVSVLFPVNVFRAKFVFPTNLRNAKHASFFLIRLHFCACWIRT